MAFSRVAALRSTLRTTRSTNFARPRPLRQIVRRGYASGGHGHAKAGGDAIWAAGSVAVTVPACWWLLANGPDTSHHGGHGEHGDSHHEKKEEGDSEEEETEEKSEEGEKGEDGDKENSDDSDSDGSKDADTPDTSEDEGENPTTGGFSKASNKKKTYPDAKGGTKKRVESEQSVKQGGPEDSIFKADENVADNRDQAAASKTAGSKATQSGKQEGVSNTDTKHSSDLSNNPDKSSKAEGFVETAKSKGTVDVNRPAK